MGTHTLSRFPALKLELLIPFNMDSESGDCVWYNQSSQLPNLVKIGGFLINTVMTMV